MSDAPLPANLGQMLSFDSAEGRAALGFGTPGPRPGNPTHRTETVLVPPVAQIPQATPVANIRQFVPDFPDITPALLSALTPEQGAALLRKMEQSRQTIHGALVKAETQAAAAQQEIDRTRAEVKAEFGVDTVEGLEELQVQQTHMILQAYAALSGQIPAGS